jgi:hypothetical protein
VPLCLSNIIALDGPFHLALHLIAMSVCEINIERPHTRTHTQQPHKIACSSQPNLSSRNLESLITTHEPQEQALPRFKELYRAACATTNRQQLVHRLQRLKMLEYAPLRRFNSFHANQVSVYLVMALISMIHSAPEIGVMRRGQHTALGVDYLTYGGVLCLLPGCPPVPSSIDDLYSLFCLPNSEWQRS